MLHGKADFAGGDAAGKFPAGLRSRAALVSIPGIPILLLILLRIVCFNRPVADAPGPPLRKDCREHIGKHCRLQTRGIRIDKEE